MKPIKQLKYEDVKFRFVSDHYDIHLNGTCYYNGSLCEFMAELPPGHYNTTTVDIYKLSLVNKLKWIWRQWLFELCVGNHWSYKNGKRNGNFYNKKPKWLYKILLNWYY